MSTSTEAQSSTFNDEKIKTGNISPSDFTINSNADPIFNIPIYQRPYAWGEVEIQQLLDDLARAMKDDNDYHIGNIVLSENKNAFDVIDGQQRLTTLFLIGKAVTSTESALDDFMYRSRKDGSSIKKDSRLHFSIREEDSNFLSQSSESDQSPRSENINRKMDEAVKTIRHCLSELKLETESFLKYIADHVRMTYLILPEGTDLNMYFEAMNSSGIQLEKHEVLKAKILAAMKGKSSEYRSQYAAIWDACSQMNQYIEDGIFSSSSITDSDQKRKSLWDYHVGPKQDEKNTPLPSCFSKNENPLRLDENTIDKLIEELEISDVERKENDTHKNIARVTQSTEVSSIVNFSTFLLHVYRIYKKDEIIAIYDGDLLKTINIDADDFTSTEFIRLLLKCRILFDQYIIKNKNVNHIYNWEINPINEKDGDKKQRTRNFETSTRIQAMLHVSTGSGLWLTKVLAYLLEEEFISDENLTKKIETIDNEIESHKLPHDDINNMLDKGTGTSRYWFHKLDYILLKASLGKEKSTKSKLHKSGIANQGSQINTFQFRFNRSVEHIHAQSKKGELDEGESLNSFGNLALISVSSNSSYNNQDFGNKKMDFIKRTNIHGIESLKLLYIYQYEKWGSIEIKKHSEEMVTYLKGHYEGSHS